MSVRVQAARLQAIKESGMSRRNRWLACRAAFDPGGEDSSGGLRELIATLRAEHDYRLRTLEEQFNGAPMLQPVWVSMPPTANCVPATANAVDVAPSLEPILTSVDDFCMGGRGGDGQ